MTGFRLNDRARKVVREVAIIVFGVLIALVVGEIATAIRNRIDARQAMAAVRADMADNAPAFEFAPIAVGCSERRLDGIATILLAARDTGRIPDLENIPARLGSTFRTGSWERAVANGNTLYVDRATVDALTDYHESLAKFRSEIDAAATGWAQLGVLAHAAGRIDDNTLSMARQTVAELRFRTRNVGIIATILLQSHRRLGLPIDYGNYNGLPFSRQDRLTALRDSPVCRPLLVDRRPHAVLPAPGTG